LGSPLITNAVQNDKVKVIIGFQNLGAPGLIAEDIDIIRGAGGVVNRKFKLIPSVSASVPAAAVPGLLANPKVKIVEMDMTVTAHDIDQTWGVKRIGCEPVHAGTFTGNNGTSVLGDNVKVAVVDTGIDYTHPQLSGIYKGGFDFVNNDNDPMDDNYHGTHCAGTVAAKRDNVGVVGVAPNIDLYGVKVLDSAGSGSYSAIIAGLEWCVDNQIQVVSMSLGSAGYPGSQTEAAFASANAAGVVIVTSAGNDGTTNTSADNVGYPARFDSCIAVASTTDSDARSGFSSTGSTVEIAAPGSDILSTIPMVYAGSNYGNPPFALLSGTSMACPHVAGVAALVISAGITDANSDLRINDEVRSLLQLTAEDLGATGRDVSFGFGLVDAELAVAMIFDPDGGGGGGGGGGGDPPEVFDPPTNLSGSATRQRVVTLNWQDNSNVEAGFEIQIGTKRRRSPIAWSDAGNTGEDVDSFQLSTSKGRKYFRVRAFKSDGSTTGWSNRITIRVK